MRLSPAKGSHTVFVHPTGMMLNVQNRKGYMLAYQADQLIAAINHFGENLEEYGMHNCYSIHLFLMNAITPG